MWISSYLMPKINQMEVDKELIKRLLGVFHKAVAELNETKRELLIDFAEYYINVSHEDFEKIYSLIFNSEVYKSAVKTMRKFGFDICVFTDSTAKKIVLSIRRAGRDINNATV